MSTATLPALHTLGVVDAAAAIRTGELAPAAYLEALLERIAAVEPAIEGWAYLDIEGARREAAALTAEAAAGRIRGPLHGVPIAIKDVFDVAGMPTVSNSRTTSATPAERDSSVARKFREAGAIILGKAQTVEFAGMGEPPTSKNPWNLAHTPGGSSSGSGALVGARMIPAAIGTQTGGSNNRPAAFCGVTGFKGTYGRIGRYGCIAVSWSMDHPGVIARSVADCAAIFHAVAGPDPDDPTTLSAEPPPAVLQTIAPPRLGVVPGFFKERSLPEMWAAVEAAAAAYAGAGAAVGHVSTPPLFDAVLQAHILVMASESVVVHARRHASKVELMAPRHRGRFEVNALVPATYYLQAQRVRRALHEELQGMFGGVDALIMPTAPGPAPAGLDSTGDASLLSPWTFVGFPSASISAGLSPEGLPMGLQVVGPPGADQQVLDVAAWCEGITGILPAPPDPA